MLKLVEAAEAILSRTDTSLSAREITERALVEGLIRPKSAKPWVHLQAAIRQRNHQLVIAGQKERFSYVKGKWKLN